MKFEPSRITVSFVLCVCLVLFVLGFAGCAPVPESGKVVASYPSMVTVVVNKVPQTTWYSNVHLDNGYFIYEPTLYRFVSCQVGETWTREGGCP